MLNPWLAEVSIRSFHIYGITAKHLEKEFQSVLNIYGKKSTNFENGFSKWVDLVPNLKFEKKTKSNLVSNVRCKWYHIDILRCFKYGIFILFLFARKKNRFCPVTPSSV